MTETTGTGPAESSEEAPEVEATLVVASEGPAGVAERIAALDGLGPYHFDWRGTEVLRDVYLDTPARELRELGVALRLRRGEAGWRITLKGPARPAAGGAVERSELEVEWSRTGLRRVLGALRERGVELSDLPSDVGTEDEPVEALRHRGLLVVQDRHTRRRRARVVPADAPERTLAWLVVDTVRFPAGSGRTVQHREVEVEATSAAPEGLPGEVAGLLRQRFGDSLRTWEHGKLVTGAAVKRLDLPAGPGGELLPAAYDRLAPELEGDEEGRG